MKTKTKLLFLVAFVFIGVNLTLYVSNEYKEAENQPINLIDVNPFSLIPIPRVRTTPKQQDGERADTYVFTSLTSAYDYMKTVELANTKRIVIQYQNFSRRVPLFIDNEDEKLFWQSSLNRENMKPTPTEQLRGVVEVIANGTFQMDYTCGFMSDSTFFKVNRTSEFVKDSEVLVPLVIPMGFLFQHFFDGTFPKIVQALELVKRPESKLLLEHPIHDNVYRILEKLNITQEKVVWHQRNDKRTVYRARHMITTCVTPPLHPALWRQMRHLLGVSDNLTVPRNESRVMLLTRAGATNGGRNALNQNEIYDYLLIRYGPRLVVFDSTMDVTQIIEQMGKVSIIIGTHGGAFYNLNYAPLGDSTTIIEFVPYDYGGRDIRALPHAIFWAQADLLAMRYWRVMCKSENYQHDMRMDLKKLTRILDIVDPDTAHLNHTVVR